MVSTAYGVEQGFRLQEILKTTILQLPLTSTSQCKHRQITYLHHSQQLCSLIKANLGVPFLHFKE